MFTSTAAVAVVEGGVQVYEGDEQKKQSNRAIGAQPHPPNTSQPDESGLVAQSNGRTGAANGRGGTVLAPPMGSSPLIPMGLGASPSAKTLGG